MVLKLGLHMAWMVMLGVLPTYAQEVDLSFLLTRAETSNYEETTRYDEAMGFLDLLSRTSSQLHLTTFGYSTEGRALPLMVFGDLPAATPEAVRATGKTRVFIQANIHAGEVCGKEAMLMLLRSLAAGQHTAWADSLVLLVAPLYNADGNERVSLYNRPRQHGPLGGMGQRANAQGLDLNRDHMKLDTPEARSLVGLMNAYDPHVLVDLHTTNGTAHAYHLTYAPPLHPNTASGIIDRLRGDWLPWVTQSIQQQYGWDYYYYGNLPWRGSNAPRGWYTFDHRPRFNNNYVGLRNRYAILSEAYAYATFEERILATRYFVEEILNYAQTHATAIRAAVTRADAQVLVGDSLAVRARFAASSAPVDILLGEVDEEQNPYTGATILRRRNVRQAEAMTEYGTFAPSEQERVPETYYIPPDLTPAVDRLQAHGITFTRLPRETVLPVERFRIDSSQVATRPFQGHQERTLFGHYEAAEMILAEGTLVVPADQPLGRLAFALLEPRSDDGLANWALLDDALEGALFYPIVRSPAAMLEGGQ